MTAIIASLLAACAVPNAKVETKPATTPIPSQQLCYIDLERSEGHMRGEFRCNNPDAKGRFTVANNVIDPEPYFGVHDYVLLICARTDDEPVCRFVYDLFGE